MTTTAIHPEVNEALVEAAYQYAGFRLYLQRTPTGRWRAILALPDGERLWKFIPQPASGSFAEARRHGIAAGEQAVR